MKIILYSNSRILSKEQKKKKITFHNIILSKVVPSPGKKSVFLFNFCVIFFTITIIYIGNIWT